MQEQLEILKRAVEMWQSQDKPVAKPLSALALEQELDVSLRDIGSNASDVENAVFDYLKYSPNSAHPEFSFINYFTQAKTKKLCLVIG